MYKGDIDNRLVPRLLINWENLVAIHPTKKDAARYTMMLKVHQWKRAVNTFVPNELVAKHLWDLTMGRYDYTLDCVTFLPEEQAEHVEEWLDREGLPFSGFHRYDPTHLARRIATMPDVAALYHTNYEYRFTFGSKGRLISPDRPDFMGVF